MFSDMLMNSPHHIQPEFDRGRWPNAQRLGMVLQFKYTDQRGEGTHLDENSILAPLSDALTHAITGEGGLTFHATQNFFARRRVAVLSSAREGGRSAVISRKLTEINNRPRAVGAARDEL
jgi:hypothetical protein